MPGGFVCSGRLQAKLRAGKVKEAVAGERTVRSLFDKKQRAFFADCAPDGIALDELTILGPIMVMKLKFSPSGYDGRLVAELWLYPDGSRILELSTKAATTDAFEVAARTRQFLEQRGIDLTGEQQTKTKTALEYFSLRAALGLDESPATHPSKVSVAPLAAPTLSAWPPDSTADRVRLNSPRSRHVQAADHRLVRHGRRHRHHGAAWSPRSRSTVASSRCWAWRSCSAWSTP